MRVSWATSFPEDGVFHVNRRHKGQIVPEGNGVLGLHHWSLCALLIFLGDGRYLGMDSKL